MLILSVSAMASLGREGRYTAVYPFEYRFLANSSIPVDRSGSETWLCLRKAWFEAEAGHLAWYISSLGDRTVASKSNITTEVFTDC
jgi:hypothetical protein